MLSDNNPHKGQFLIDVVMKSNVIFSRVSPDQKLQVVNACKNLQHIVAVTGDGINDCPAMKRSDIGIAMNITGTEVTKDTADILILDDNFENICRGMKKGRTVFDILKRMLAYNLTSNIAEVAPVLISFFAKFPVPMNAIQILVIDLLSDVYVNITYAYERAESDVMQHPPRDINNDSLCSFKLFGFSYLFFGWIETVAGFLAFFTVLNDYGLKLNGVMGIVHEKGIEPAPNDFYNADDIYKGNTNAFIFENAEYLGFNGDEYDKFLEDKHRLIDWFTEEDSAIDFRLFFYQSENDYRFGECAFPGRTMHHDSELCYTLDSVRHAQTAYFANVIMIQVMNGLCFRTISVSLFEHIMDNWDCNLAYFIVQGVMAMMLYVPKLNNAFGCRPLIIQHWVPGLGVWIVMFTYSEFLKYLIRNVKEPDGSPGFFSRRFKF